MRPESPGGGDPAQGVEGTAPAEPAAAPAHTPGPPVKRPGARARPHRARSAAGRRHPGLAVSALVLSLVVLAVSAAGLVAQIMPRSFSPAQRQQIIAWEMGKRWRAWPTGKIFPAALGYHVPGSVLQAAVPLNLKANRIGIANQASCRAATEGAVAGLLTRHGCLAMLRATYDDATQSLALTIGVAVLPGPAAAQAVAGALPPISDPSPGLRVVRFRRTPVTSFGQRQRQLSWHRAAGPYLIFATAGYADGRPWMPRHPNPYARSEMLSLAAGLGEWVASHLGAAPPSPHCPGTVAC